MATANPTIAGSGTAQFGPGHYCTIETKDGTTATITIGNSSTSDQLTVSISGAPNDAKGTYNNESKPLNGFWKLEANSPEKIQSMYNFKGRNVLIANNNHEDAKCIVDVIKLG